MKGNNYLLKNKKGFTLVELVVVIAIIGVLAMILIPSLIGYVRKASRKADIVTARHIYTTVQQLLIENDKAYNSFYEKILKGEGSWTKMTLRCDGEDYDVIAVCRADAGRNGEGKSGDSGVEWKTSIKECKPFLDAMNASADLTQGLTKKNYSPYPMKYRNHGDDPDKPGDFKDNGYDYRDIYTDRWGIVYRVDDPAMIEIWACDSSGRWGCGHRYRVFPSPCAEYQ